MRLVGKTPNKALKTDAIDSAPVAHGFAILCTTGAPLLRRLAWRYARLRRSLSLRFRKLRE